MSIMDPELRTPTLPALSPPRRWFARQEAPAQSRLCPWAVDRFAALEPLTALREEWNELLGTSRADHLFLTWEWLHTWWKHCGGEAGLEVRTVRFGRDLLAIAPFRVARSRSCPSIHARALQFLGGGNVGSDYLDLIVRPARRAETLQLLADSLDADRHLIDLGRVLRGGTSASALAQRLERNGWSAIRRVTDVCPYVPLQGHSFESYLESLGASHRYNFRRRLRQLERGFELRFERVSTEEERRQAIEILFRLHLERFEGRGGSDALHTPALLAFHRDFSEIALRRGWLRLYVLRLDGRPAAALYGFQYGGRFLYYQAGFDAAFARHSVGLVAMGLAIRAAIEDGAREYDLLHGDEPYKALWARSRRELERIELFPPTAAGHAHRLLRSGARGARRRLAGLTAASAAVALPWLGRRQEQS